MSDAKFYLASYSHCDSGHSTDDIEEAIGDEYSRQNIDECREQLKPIRCQYSRKVIHSRTSNSSEKTTKHNGKKLLQNTWSEQVCI